MRRWKTLSFTFLGAALALATTFGCHGGRYYDDDCYDGYRARRPSYRSHSYSHRGHRGDHHSAGHRYRSACD